MNKDPVTISRKQQERLEFLEFRLYFFGELRRSNISEQFGVAPACATRDIALYRQMMPGNLTFDQVRKCYEIMADFIPHFHHSSERVLMSIADGTGSLGESAIESINSLSPCGLQKVDIDVLATVSRAISLGRVVRVRYLSRVSGSTSRDIVPYAVVNSGFGWHVRSFDRGSSTFKDFALSRMKSAASLVDIPLSGEKKEEDMEWNRIVELELAPHPGCVHKDAVRHAYGINGGYLKVRVRSAVAGYFLRYWNVDCSVNFELDALHYELCLCNHHSLCGVSSAAMAPGYKNTESHCSLV